MGTDSHLTLSQDVLREVENVVAEHPILAERAVPFPDIPIALLRVFTGALPNWAEDFSAHKATYARDEYQTRAFLRSETGAPDPVRIAVTCQLRELELVITSIVSPDNLTTYSDHQKYEAIKAARACVQLVCVAFYRSWKRCAQAQNAMAVQGGGSATVCECRDAPRSVPSEPAAPSTKDEIAELPEHPPTPFGIRSKKARPRLVAHGPDGDADVIRGINWKERKFCEAYVDMPDGTKLELMQAKSG